MKTALALFFASFLLLQGFLPEIDLHEINKLPSLYEHYQSHRQKEKHDFSFWDFLCMHYADSEHSQAENHEKLPLFHHHCQVIPNLSLPQHVELVLPMNIDSQIIYNQNLSVDIVGFSGRIFQPPKA